MPLFIFDSRAYVLNLTHVAFRESHLYKTGPTPAVDCVSVCPDDTLYLHILKKQARLHEARLPELSSRLVLLTFGNQIIHLTEQAVYTSQIASSLELRNRFAASIKTSVATPA